MRDRPEVERFEREEPVARERVREEVRECEEPVDAARRRALVRRVPAELPRERPRRCEAVLELASPEAREDERRLATARLPPRRVRVLLALALDERDRVLLRPVFVAIGLASCGVRRPRRRAELRENSWRPQQTPRLRLARASSADCVSDKGFAVEAPALSPCV